MQDWDFDLDTNRRASNSIKWRKYAAEVIPLWIADMDFQTAPAIRHALAEEVAHGVFGYAEHTASATDTACRFVEQRYSWAIDPDWIVWIPSARCGMFLASLIAGPDGAGALSMPPVYPPFLKIPAQARKQLRRAVLREQDMVWRMDFEKIDSLLSDNTPLVLLCNPHNPTGRVYRQDELRTLADLCHKHNAIICSDELHCELLLEPDLKHIPIASLDEDTAQRTITLMGPGKTFNIAGLCVSFAIIPNHKLRRRFREQAAAWIPDVPTVGITAVEAAYKHGQPWVEALLSYLRENRGTVENYIAKIPGLQMTAVEATYLAWIDVRQLNLEDAYRTALKAGVALSPGGIYGLDGFLRLNFACRRSVLEEGLERLQHALTN